VYNTIIYTVARVYLCKLDYLDMNPLTLRFSAGLPGSGANMSLILTHPAVPMPTTTAPNILTEKQRNQVRE